MLGIYVIVFGLGGATGYWSWSLVNNNYFSNTFAECYAQGDIFSVSNPTMTETSDLTRCHDIGPRPFYGNDALFILLTQNI